MCPAADVNERRKVNKMTKYSIMDRKTGKPVAELKRACKVFGSICWVYESTGGEFYDDLYYGIPKEVPYGYDKGEQL